MVHHSIDFKKSAVKFRDKNNLNRDKERYSSGVWISK